MVHQRLSDWLADRLGLDHAFLKTPDCGADAAARLVEEGHVAVEAKTHRVGPVVTCGLSGAAGAGRWSTPRWLTANRRAFLDEARRYVPALADTDAAPATSGIRAQAVDDRGGLVDDFVIDGTKTVVHVRNAPSPAATSSLAIAEELYQRIRT